MQALDPTCLHSALRHHAQRAPAMKTHTYNTTEASNDKALKPIQDNVQTRLISVGRASDLSSVPGTHTKNQLHKAVF